MKTIAKLTLATAIFAAAPLTVFAAGHAAAPASPAANSASSSSSSSSSAADKVDGEVRNVDKSAKKITIKHGELKKLEMPPMTMVFEVKDPAMLDKVKQGDKVTFVAEKIGGQFTVTDIEKQ